MSGGRPTMPIQGNQVPQASRQPLTPTLTALPSHYNHYKLGQGNWYFAQTGLPVHTSWPAYFEYVKPYFGLQHHYQRELQTDKENDALANIHLALQKAHQEVMNMESGDPEELRLLMVEILNLFWPSDRTTW